MRQDEDKLLDRIFHKYEQNKEECGSRNVYRERNLNANKSLKAQSRLVHKVVRKS